MGRQHLAVFALSGDPATNGHLRVIRYGSQNFDTLHVVLANNSDKKYTFSEDDRHAMLDALVADMANVLVHRLPAADLLVRFADRLGATTLLRGVRNGSDHEYERMMADFNEWMVPGISTVCVGPEPGRPFVSSSFVKSLIGKEDWREYVSQLVPGCVMPYLERFAPTKLPVKA